MMSMVTCQTATLALLHYLQNQNFIPLIASAATSALSVMLYKSLVANCERFYDQVIYLFWQLTFYQVGLIKKNVNLRS